jgi:hypothetical protein
LFSLFLLLFTGCFFFLFCVLLSSFYKSTTLGHSSLSSIASYIVMELCLCNQLRS